MYQIVDAYFRLSTIFAKGFFYFHGYLYELIRLGLSYCHGDKKILTKKKSHFDYSHNGSGEYSMCTYY